jgi:hypothetical protein
LVDELRRQNADGHVAILQRAGNRDDLADSDRVAADAVRLP